MWDDLSMIFQDVLGSGERLLWSGRPKQGLLFRSSDLFMVPFSLLWGGFAVFWEASVISSGAPFFFMIWGIPFVLVGVYMIVGRFFVDAWQRNKTFYGLTDERVIIVSGLFGRTIKSLNLSTLADVNLDQKGGGNRGTITFGPAGYAPRASFGRGWPGSERYAPPSFEMIEDARRVYDQIRGAQKALKA